MNEQNKETINQQLTIAVEWIMRSDLPNQEKLLIVLLLRNGLRISDICNPETIRKIDDWTVSLSSSKNKSLRICNLFEAKELEDKFNLIQDIKFWKRNRFYYYRKLKGLLPNVETQRTKNTAVTHAARNIKAQSVFDATGDKQATIQSIGNRSKSATSRYLRREQRRTFLLQGVENAASGTIRGTTIRRNNVIF